VKPYKFIISGGGTGGHIYPAIAIANELKRCYPDAEFLFVGAKDRMEMVKVPKAGYAIEGLWISGIQRNLKLSNLAFPLKLASSLTRSRKILKEFKPDVAIGTGGYASAPLLRVASNRGIPCLIQEQNSHAGITNKWLSKKVRTICVAYLGMEKFFPQEKIVLTGNPVRDDLLDVTMLRDQAQEYFKLDKNKKTLLVLGGSLGARRINQLIKSNLPFIESQGVQLIWQCGSIYWDTYKNEETANIRMKDFIYRMDLAYAAADFIISRAGALSVSELCLVGKPVIFIPSPNVAEDHQTKNAAAITSQGAAIMLKENELDEKFVDTFKELAFNKELQYDLGRSISKLAKPEATKQIVEEIKKLLKR